MLTGTLAGNLPGRGERGPLLADWRGPKDSATGLSIAMSESDWLKLADDLAPVSYLPAPVQNEQQPL